MFFSFLNATFVMSLGFHLILLAIQIQVKSTAQTYPKQLFVTHIVIEYK